MAIKALIFDIDGVLADSREAVAQNTMALLAEFGHSVPGSRVRGMSSAHSADSVLIALVPALLNDKELLGRMLARLSWITQENMHLVKATPLAAQVPELSKKYSIAAASNRKSSARMVLEKLCIGKYFSAVLTSADAPAKPAPGMILLALERLGVAPSEAVFIGDNAEDMAAGKAAGVKSVMLDGTDERECGKLLKMLAGAENAGLP